MRFNLLIPLALLATALHAQQTCPTDGGPDIPASITGTLEYHPGVYAWYALRPTQPVCEQNAIQVSPPDPATFRDAHRFIGCEVTATGNLFVPDTGYWSTPLGIDNAHVQPSPSCKPGNPLPDYSAIPIPSSLHSYKVTATYNPRTSDFSAQATDATEKPLSPWQAYVTDIGNGAHDLQRMYCADGFTASAPKDPTGKPDLQANIDPDSPEVVEVTITNDTTPVHLAFICTRSAAPPNE